MLHFVLNCPWKGKELSKGSSFLKRIFCASSICLFSLAVTGCQQAPQNAPQGAAGMQAMPVKTIAVSLQPVAQSNEYMATIKSRRSATILPQVSGLLTKILVHSGERVKAGQALMTIDPRQQQANVASQRATEQQKKASSTTTPSSEPPEEAV